MKFLFLCGRETAYPLNRFLIDCLRHFNTVEVIGEEWPPESIFKRSTSIYLHAFWKIFSKKYDLIFVSFYGHLLMLPFGLYKRAPVLFYPFISTYETLVYDRKNYTANSLLGRMAFWLDYITCHNATHILMDTQANIDYFSKTFSIPLNQFSKIYIGSDERIFFPREHKKVDDQIIVLFHGSYLPLHGIDVIIQAAHALRDQAEIHFRLVGKGLGYERILQLSRELNLTNIEFMDNVPVQQLPEIISTADICLGGHFGSSEKALRVIAGKTFQDIAMEKATIVGDTPANKELLTHGYDAWFCTPNDPDALANSIKTLAEDHAIRTEIGYHAYQTFTEKASLRVLVPQLQTIVEQMLPKKIK